MKERVLYLQSAPGGLKALVAEPSNGRGWRAVRTLELREGEAADSGDLVRRLKESVSGRGGPSRCVLTLHREEMAVLKVELPEGDALETESMLELELTERLPLDPSEICYGWERIGSAEGRQTLQVYWTPLSRVEPWMERAQEAGLHVTDIYPALAFYRRLVVPEPPGGPVCFVRAGSDGFELAQWESGGALGFSLGLRIAGAESNGNQRKMQAALAEAVGGWKERLTCIETAQRFSLSANGYGPAEGWAEPAGLREALAKLKAEEGREEFVPLAAAAELLSAGAGEESWRRTLNMLPRSVGRAREARRTRRLWIEAGLLLSGIVALGLANLWLYAQRMDDQWREAQAGAARLAPVAKQVEGMEERIGSIREQIDYVMSPVDALQAINALLAQAGGRLDGLYLDQMTYKASGAIAMEGHATNQIAPWEFAATLDKSGRFRIAQRPRIFVRQYGEARLIRFSLSVQALSAQAGEAAP